MSNIGYCCLKISLTVSGELVEIYWALQLFLMEQMQTRNATAAAYLFRTSHRLSNETTGGTAAKNRAQKPAKVRSLYGSFYIAADSPTDALQLRTNIYVVPAGRINCPCDPIVALYGEKR